MPNCLTKMAAEAFGACRYLAEKGSTLVSHLSCIRSRHTRSNDRGSWVVEGGRWKVKGKRGNSRHYKRRANFVCPEEACTLFSTFLRRLTFSSPALRRSHSTAGTSLFEQSFRVPWLNCCRGRAPFDGVRSLSLSLSGPNKVCAGPCVHDVKLMPHQFVSLASRRAMNRKYPVVRT